MQCKKCGAEAPAESAFCPKCGAPLADSPAGATGNVPGGTPRVVAAARGMGSALTEDELWAGAYSAKAMAGTFATAGALTLLAAVVCIFGGPAAWTGFLIGAVSDSCIGIAA